MAAPRVSGDSLLNLERHRQQLECNVTQLRKALRYWRLWDAEHEGLKQELQELPDDAGEDAIVHLHKVFEPGEVLMSKELNEVFGCNTSRNAKPTKTRPQMINTIEKRIDVATRNIETLEKQLSSAEENLTRATVVIKPDLENEEGSPIMDIVEELDEDGNVVSSRVQTPGSRHLHAMSTALDKASLGRREEKEKETGMGNASGAASQDPVQSGNVQPIQEPAQMDGKNQPQQVTADRSRTSTSSPSKTSAPVSTTQQAAVEISCPERGKRSPPKRKSILKKAVAFSQDTREPDSAQKSPTTFQVGDILQASKKEVRTQQADVISQGQFPEEVFLREEMLRFGREDISEIGAVVAELTLEEDSDDDEEDLEDGEDMHENSDECHDVAGYSEDNSDEENEWGMSTRSLMTSDYINRMKALEQKLGLARESSSPNPPTLAAQVAETNKHKTCPVPTEEEAPKTSVKTVATKKSVSFAPKLDIAPDLPPFQAASRSAPLSKPQQVSQNPVAETVVECTTPSSSSPSSTTTKQQPHYRSCPLAETITERPISVSTRNQAWRKRSKPDEAILIEEAVDEYPRARSSRIHRHGGFPQTGEEDRGAGKEIEPVHDGGTSSTRRLSRFKATRFGGL